MLTCYRGGGGRTAEGRCLLLLRNALGGLAGALHILVRRRLALRVLLTDCNIIIRLLNEHVKVWLLTERP